MGEASAPASLPLTPHTHSVHPLSWASLPPPAGSRSIPHTPFAQPPNWASLPFPITPTGQDLATSAGRAFRPQLAYLRLSLPAPYFPSPAPTFRPQLASYPSKLRLNWLSFPGPQLGVPSAPNMLAIHSPYPLRVYSRSGDPSL